MTASTVAPNRRSAHAALTAAGGLGIVALLLPFTLDTSPYGALTEWGLWRLVLPAFLVAFILPASLRWMTAGTLSGRARSIGYALAAGAAVLILLSYLQLEAWPDGPAQWVAVVGPVLILGFGATLLVRTRGPGRLGGYTPIMALQVVYIANAMLALGASFPDWQVGAYCIVVTIMAYALQIDLVRHTPGSSIADASGDP
ncbi:MAG: hypothetical protein R2910_07940 [Gemmatimonadales bacterium]